MYPLFIAFLIIWIHVHQSQASDNGFNFNLQLPNSVPKRSFAPHTVYYPVLVPHPWPRMAPQHGQKLASSVADTGPEPTSDQSFWASANAANSRDYPNVMYNGYYVPMYPAPPQPEASSNGFALNIGVKPYRPTFDLGGLLKGILDGTAGIVSASEFKKRMDAYERILKMNSLLNNID